MNERLYKIGEAACMVELESYVLRYWETEFSHLCPKRTPKGQRLYSDKDIDLLFKIRYLLHEQGLTIEGARKVLKNSSLSQTNNTHIHAQLSDTNTPDAQYTTSSQEIPKINTLLSILKTVEHELFLMKQLLQ